LAEVEGQVEEAVGEAVEEVVEDVARQQRRWWYDLRRPWHPGFD